MYIVTVSHGEYDDHSEHNLCVVKDKEAAEFVYLSLMEHEDDYLYLLEKTGLEPGLMQKEKDERDAILENYGFFYEEIEELSLK